MIAAKSSMESAAGVVGGEEESNSTSERTRDGSSSPPHAEAVAVGDDVPCTTQRSAIPELMDNPLYEGISEEITRAGGICYGSLEPKQQAKRTPLSRLSLDESNVAAKQGRRLQSWSLSSRDYEGIWRTVQENVFKSSGRRDSISALEDFKLFRQKLANLKQVKEDISAPPPTPTIVNPMGSVRSVNLGSISNRSLNLSPSRPTSPLQRLSVMTNRRGVSGLNPRRDASHRSTGIAPLPPSVHHRFALSMRAEGLFRLPNPAAISPLTSELYGSPPRVPPTGTVASKPSLPIPEAASPASSSKRRFFNIGRAAAASTPVTTATIATAAADSKKSGSKAAATTVTGGGGGGCGTGNRKEEACTGRSPRTPRVPRSTAAGLSRSSVVTAVSNEVEALMNSCSPRTMAALNTVSPKSTPRNASHLRKQQQQQQPQQQPQQQQQGGSRKKVEKTVALAAASCSPRSTDVKGRCIHIPRPMCYSAAQILE